MRLIDADKGMERIKKSVFFSDMETTLGLAAFKELVESSPTEKAVEIEHNFESILLYAVRYATMTNGEPTCTVINYIKFVFPCLSKWCRSHIANCVYDFLNNEEIFADRMNDPMYTFTMIKWRELKSYMEELWQKDAQKEVENG